MPVLLTKALLAKYRQCPLRMWNDVNLTSNESHKEKLNFNSISKHDKKLLKQLLNGYAGQGLSIDTSEKDESVAVKLTLDALSQPGDRVIYNPVFKNGRISTHTDIIIKNNGSLALWCLKPIINIKHPQRFDLALQANIINKILEEQHIKEKINTTYLVIINKKYYKQDENILPDKFFILRDSSKIVASLKSRADKTISKALKVLESKTPPNVVPGANCAVPSPCPYLGNGCELPVKSELLNLPGVGEAKLKELKESGVTCIEDLNSDNIEINAELKRALRAWKTGKRQIEPELKPVLENIGYPRFFLDFEAAQPVIPRWKGTKAFEMVPFQYSLHLQLNSTENAVHYGYLHKNTDDPRRQLTENLLKRLEEYPEAKIICYSEYEGQVIGRFIKDYRDLSTRLKDVRNRIVDLLAIVRSYVYDNEFKGRYSLKSILPAFDKSSSYEDLVIADGPTAAHMYLEMIDLIERRNNETLDQVSSDKINNQIESIYSDLWKYCSLDTSAMISLLNSLEREVGIIE